MRVQWKTQDVKIEKNFDRLISNRYLNISFPLTRERARIAILELSICSKGSEIDLEESGCQ